jgi:glycerophosphoryl diester phosphodiesterase
MNLDYLYKDKTIYFGHRGERNVAPENTISSYQSAIKKGLKAIELDVMITKDNKLVCSHNIDVERETTGQGFVDELTYKELSHFKAGKDFPKKKQDKIPLLSDVLKALPEDILINIEIKTKSAFDLRATKQVAKMIKSNTIKQNILVSSFNPVAVRYFKIYVRGIPTGFIYEYAQHFKGVFIAKPDCLHPDTRFIDDKLINFCRKRGMRINTWTVNNSHARDWLIDRKISGIITDNPKISINA